MCAIDRDIKLLMTKYGGVFFQNSLKRNKIQSQIVSEFKNGVLYFYVILSHCLKRELHLPVKGSGRHVNVTEKSGQFLFPFYSYTQLNGASKLVCYF